MKWNDRFINVMMVGRRKRRERERKSDRDRENWRTRKKKTKVKNKERRKKKLEKHRKRLKALFCFWFCNGNKTNKQTTNQPTSQQKLKKDFVSRGRKKEIFPVGDDVNYVFCNGENASIFSSPFLVRPSPARLSFFLFFLYNLTLMDVFCSLF